MKNLKNLALIVLIVISGWFVFQNNKNDTDLPSEKPVENNRGVLNAVNKKLSNIQVAGSGKVSRILSDDNYGSRHQRFVLRLDSNHTVLVAHNIDLAPRINWLKQGDEVEFYGEYEWNAKGGVIHWTHHDPNGHHEDGWLKHNGRAYK